MNTEHNKIIQKLEIHNQVIEMISIISLSIVVFILAAYYDALETIVVFSQQHEDWELDEIITVSVFLMFGMAFFSTRRWLEVRKARALLIQSNEELQKTLSEIKQLRGIIPICSSCKKIRDDEGSWHQVESYVRDHTDAEFSHGICPICMIKLYPDLIEDEEE